MEASRAVQHAEDFEVPIVWLSDAISEKIVGAGVGLMNYRARAVE
jgi:hypothetical protein